MNSRGGWKDANILMGSLAEKNDVRITWNDVFNINMVDQLHSAASLVQAREDLNGGI